MYLTQLTSLSCFQYHICVLQMENLLGWTSVSMLSIHDFSCCRINVPFLAPFLCAIIRETTLLGKSTRHSWPLERTDRISTYGSLLWNGRKPPAANPADLVVSWLVYSAAWGLGAGSVGTLLHFHAHNLLPPLHQPPSNHLRWSHRMPPPPQPSSSPSHQLLYSCTSYTTPHTEHPLLFYTSLLQQRQWVYSLQ